MATTLLVCLVLFAAASAVPVMRDDVDLQSDFSTNQCAIQCKGSQDKFHYQPDTTYVYNYKAEAETTVAGAAEDKARMYIETTANIEVISQCEFALRLKDVKLYHSQPDSDSMKPAENMYEFQSALVENTLRFSFDDGVISDICHPAQEKIWVLNFKRGLLSSFQNSMDDFEKNQKVKEIDVTGECQAEYTKKGEWIWERSIKIAKTKNLMACYQHSGMRTLIPMVPYRVASDIQSLPIVKSSHECDFVISSSGVLDSAVCAENHVFAPFSNHQSGGATKVKQTLTFVTTKRGVETGRDNVGVRSNLLFKHMNGIDQVQNNKQVAEQKLREICDQTKYDVRPETPRLFNEIVQSVKDIESSDLMDLYNMVKDKRLCRQSEKAIKFLLDSLPIAGTKGALEVMAIVINDGEILDVEKKVWLTGLSLIPEPSEDMLPSLMDILNGKFADQALLPVSALLNTMCRKNVDCENSYKFKKIVDKMNENIGYSCNSDDRPKLMETLRAIGNVGCGKDFLKTLKTCLSSRYAPLEVKVAAVDAYRRFQCQENEENGDLMEVLEAQNADPELRIMSFLSLMRCPTDSVLQKIVAQLDKEQDVQVGTFIFTHMESLKQTSDPHKQDVAEAVKRLSLKPFENGGFKTSRSHESSALVNRFNLGYVANGDLIWSPASVVPRAMRVNLTVEMFGNSINFFEAGARVDGFDRFVQKYFGSEGYFSHDQTTPEDLEAFIYARMFGNELFFKHMKGTQEYEKVKSHINFDKLLENLSKKYDFKYTHSQQLIDQSLIIPTTIGLPVNMTVNSSATVDTETKGEIDFSGILSRTKPISVTSNIAASAGLEVTGSMMVDAMLYKQGVRMRNTLHSSINLKASLKITKRQTVDFEIDSPEEKQEIFDARSQFFIVHDYIEKEQEMIKENRKEIQGCTGEKFSKATGVELCGEISYPNATMVEDAPYFPLTGPVRATVVMNKKDTQRSYKIFAKWMRSPKKLEAQLQLDTPGSRVDRHISADVTIGTHKNSHVDMIFISPWKKLVVNAKAAQNKDIASLTGNVVVDESKQYTLKSEVKMEKVVKGTKFMPYVEIEDGKDRITLLKGTVSYTKDIIASLEVQDLKKQLYTIESELLNNSEEKRIDVSVGVKGGRPYRLRIGSLHKRSGRKNQNIQIDPEILIQIPRGQIVSVKSTGEFQPKPTKVMGSISLYSDLVRMRQPMTFKFDVSQKRQSYPVTVELRSPLVSAGLKGSVDIGKKNHKADLKIVYKTESMRDSITFAGRMQDKSKTHYCHYKMKSTLKFKKMSEYNTLSNLEITHKKKLTAQLNVQFTEKPKTYKRQPDIQAVASFLASIKDLTQVQIEADLKAKMPEQGVDIDMKLDHRHNSKKLESEVKIHLAPFIAKDINADIRIQDKGRSLFDVTALGNVETGSKKYSLKSELVQKSKRRFEHSLTIQDDQQEKHSFVTVYKKTNDRHEIDADFESTQLDEPLKLRVSADLNKPTDFHIRGNLNENNNELYSVDVLSKREGETACKWIVELAHPNRKVKAQVDLTKVNNRYDADFIVNWNVRSQETPAPEVRLTSQMTYVSDSKSLLLKTNQKLFTPFEDYEKIHSIWNFEMSESDMKSIGKTTFGKSRKHVSTRLTAKLPLSFEKADVSLQVRTPFEDYKEIDVQLDHTLNSQIKTELKAKVNNDKSEMIIKGTKDIDVDSRHIRGQVTLTTPYESYRRINMQFEHFDNNKRITTSAKINKDGAKYNVDFQLLTDKQYSKIEKSGFLNLAGPERSVNSRFTVKCQNGKHQIEASVRTEQDKYTVDIAGTYHDLLHHILDVDVKTPLKDARQIGLQMEQRIGKKLKSKIIAEINHSKLGYDVTLKNNGKEQSTDIVLYDAYISEMKSPLHLKSSLQYDSYPVTVSGQIGWSPSSIIGFTGSYKAQSIDDMEISLKVTTPFQSMKDIDFVASNVLKRSIRVSHLNLEFDSREMIDVEVKTQNEDTRKVLRVKLSMPRYGLEVLDTGVSMTLTNGVFSKADVKLILTPEEKYEGTFSLKIDSVNNVKGKVTIKTPIEGLELLEGSLVRESDKTDNGISLTLTSGNGKLIDIEADTDIKKDEINIKITTTGKLLPHILETVDGLRIFPKLSIDKDGNEIQQLTVEVNEKEQDQTVQIDGYLIADFGKNQQKSSVTLRVTGESVSDIDMYVSLTNQERTMQGKLVLKFVDGVRIQALVTDIFGDKHGIEYTYSGDSYKSEYKGTIYAHEFRHLESSMEVLVSSIQRIEFKSTTKTDVKGYELTQVKYTHDGQDNRASCSLSTEDMKGIKASINLVGQTSPIHLFSLIVKTPFKNYKKMVISGDYDETKINGLVEFNGVKLFSLSGTHNDFKNPKFTLKTPLRQLQVLSVNVDGQLSDGSSSFFLQFNDNDQIDGNVAIKYDGPSQVTIDAQFKSSIESSENKIKFEMETSQQPRRNRVLFVFNDINELKYFSESDPSNNKNRMDLEMKYPSLGIQTHGFLLNLEGSEHKYTGKLQMFGNTIKVVDADIEIDMKDEMKASFIVRQPEYLKYTFTRENFPESNENTLYFNWDKNDPDASLVIKATHKDESTSNKMDKSVSLSLSCPKRSIGFEHSIKATKRDVQSSGKIYWNDDSSSKVSYELKLKDGSNRRQTSYDGKLKLELPTRTIGFAGNAKDQSGERQVETTFSWDLDNDSSKKIGVKARFQEGAHTQADVSLILPKDAHVDSKLVMNKGNTILEGQTKIFYSADSRKTLTLFSKLENNPGQTSFFSSSEDKSNYSIQLGLSHPDSNIDVKMVSHLGVDSERLTSSVGIDYLTARKQLKNTGLFVEINRIKKEINLHAATPYKNIGLAGSISHNPMEIKMSSTVDEQKALSARLMIDQTQKKAQFDYTNKDKSLYFSAGFPKKTALLLQRERHENGQIERDIKILLQLTTPHLLQTDLQWTPGMLMAFRDRVLDIVKTNVNDLKYLSEEIVSDVKAEAYAKYEDISESVIDDVKKGIISLVQELATIEDELDQIPQSLGQDFDFCFKIGNFDLNEEVVRLQPKLQKVMTNFNKIVKAYTQSQKDTLRVLLTKLDVLKNMPAEEVYATIIREVGWIENQLFNTFFYDFIKFLHDLSPEVLEDIWRVIHDIIKRQYDPTVVIDELNQGMEEFKKMKLTSLLAKTTQANQQLASKLKLVAHKLSSFVSAHPYTQQVVDVLEENANEFYQVARWSINYLEIENELPKHLDNLVDYVNEVMEEGLKKQMGSVYRLVRNPVTKFDPEQGILQAEIPLLIPVDRLDQVPSVRQITEKVASYVKKEFGTNTSSTTPVTKMPLDTDFDEYDQRLLTRAPTVGHVFF